MVIQIPESTNKLANEIIKSWTNNQSKYIIIAPPLIPAKPLFNLLSNASYVEGILGKTEFSKLSISSLDNLNFSDDKRFVAKILKDWGVADQFIVIDDPVMVLEEATNIVINQGRSPILIIQRFHDALKKLSEDIGIMLRNLNDEFNLKTVVELPLPLKDLRQRWEFTDGNVPFLVSDFGQGHLNKLLSGFSLHEIEVLVKENNGNDTDAVCIFEETGGLPELVIISMDFVGKMKKADLQKRLRGLAESYFDRMISWLDREDSNIYKKLVRDKFIGRNPGTAPFRLDQHPWGTLLIDQNGELRIKMLGIACLETLRKDSREDTAALFIELFKANNFEAPSFYFKNNQTVEYGGIPSNIWLQITEFANCINKENWREVKSLGDKLVLNLAIYNDNGIQQLKIDLEAWIVFSSFFSCYLDAKKIAPKNSGELTLEEFICNKNTVPSEVVSYLQLKLLRLKKDDKLAIVATPETVLQIYMSMVLGVKFYNFVGFKNEDEIKFQEFLKGQPYQIPKAGDKLGFDAMLKYILFSNPSLDEHLRLIKSEVEASNISKSYKTRCYQVHSTALTNESDWREQKKMCDELLSKLIVILDKVSEVRDLPNISETLINILR